MSTEDAESEKAETRWPMAGAVITIIVLTVLVPDEVRLGPPWFLPALEGGLLIALIAGDPNRITRRSQVLRAMAIGLVCLLALSALWGTIFLIHQLLIGGSVTNEAKPLLAAGLKVWAGNVLAFALLYWELDGGGAVARLERMPVYPDLAFPQQTAPQIAPPGWRPRFVDYLYLSVTNSLAFSPTDVMPLVPWAKVSMAVQAAVSFSIIGLVIARAVNVFS